MSIYKVGDRVNVWKYGAWYFGTVTAVRQTRCTVRFYTKGGKAKDQTFIMSDASAIKPFGNYR